MRSIICTLVPITRLNSKIEIPAANASVASVGPVPPPLPHMERYEFERRQEEDAIKAKAERKARDLREQRQREANGLVDGVTYQ